MIIQVGWEGGPKGSSGFLLDFSAPLYTVTHFLDNFRNVTSLRKLDDRPVTCVGDSINVAKFIVADWRL
jgi:hypothetical protein